MENKIISNLNNKVWYRFLKVAFITIFFIVLLVINFSIVGGTWGNNYVFLGAPSPNVQFSTPLNGIQLLIISNFVVLLIFEAIRRIFYYIVLGSFKFQK